MNYLQIPEWSSEGRNLDHAERNNLIQNGEAIRETVLADLLNHIHVKAVDPDSVFSQTSSLLGCNFSRIEDLLFGLHLSDQYSDYNAAVSDLKKWATLSLFIDCRMNLSVKTHSRTLSTEAVTDALDRLIPCLPHKPTSEQLSAAIGCLWSFAKSNVIQRHMLYGDVGFGKTTPIGLIAAACVLNGWTAVVMCPLTPLANQIFNTLRQWFEQTEIQVKLVTADTDEQSIEPGCLYVGTTALLHCDIKNVDVLIADEEHRFGVSQINKMSATNCHYLASSATPIPRTVSLISLGLFKELVLSKPFVEKCINSEVVDIENFGRVVASVRNCLKSGGQALFICCQKHASETSSKQHLLTCEEAFNKLQVFFPNDVVQVNSDLSIEECEKNLALIRNGQKSIMVATTSVEVGIDLPKLLYIGIYNPERFGLAQLHQLRGRVGRQGDHAVCHLITTKHVTTDQLSRLNFLASTTDGRLIAEFDADRRGWGSLFDTKQSGKYQHTFLDNYSPTVQEMTEIRNLFLFNQKAQ